MGKVRIICFCLLALIIYNIHYLEEGLLIEGIYHNVFLTVGAEVKDQGLNIKHKSII